MHLNLDLLGWLSRGGCDGVQIRNSYSILMGKAFVKWLLTERYNIKMAVKMWTGAQNSIPVTGFGISCVEPSGPVLSARWVLVGAQMQRLYVTE
jgi:hypothetical protein